MLLELRTLLVKRPRKTFYRLQAGLHLSLSPTVQCLFRDFSSTFTATIALLVVGGNFVSIHSVQFDHTNPHPAQSAFDLPRSSAPLGICSRAGN